jgi:putative phosphoesterase
MDAVRIPLKPDGTLRLGVVADTHSKPNAAGVAHLAALKPDAILHAGDIGELASLDCFRALAPLLVVRGNIDSVDSGIPEQLTVELTAAEDRTVFRLLLLHIAVAGPRLRADAFKAARAQAASLVVCGHSHVPFIGRDRGLTLFNPGSIGPRRFHLPILFGAIDVAPTGVSLRHIDCETGKRWEPPG